MKLCADVFTFGYAHEPVVNAVRNSWDGQAFADRFTELRSAETTLEMGGAFVGLFSTSRTSRILAVSILNLPGVSGRDMSMRDHVGSHPSIMREIAADPGFLQHCRFIRRKITDAMKDGYQAVNVSVVCKQNRRRSVAGRILIEDMLLHVAGLAVPMQHCNSDQSWPLMNGPCRGTCDWCTHRTGDAEKAYEDVLTSFRQYLDGDSKESSACVLTCESEPERAAPVTAPDDEPEEIAASPLDVPPQGLETAAHSGRNSVPRTLRNGTWIRLRVK